MSRYLKMKSMNINRHNYEEFFILYLDNELDSDGRRKVEEFAEKHPDLRDELDLLMQSKFTPDASIVYEGKEDLLVGQSGTINTSNYGEWLMAYSDHELDESARKEVEDFISRHPFAQTELDLLQKVKLQPESIIFPYKDSLYRTTASEPRIAALWWRKNIYRVAVAAMLLLVAGSSVFLLLDQQNGTTGGTLVENDPTATETRMAAPVETPEPATTASAGNENPGKKESSIPATASPNKYSRQYASRDNRYPAPKQVKDPAPGSGEDKVAVSQPSDHSNNLPGTGENPYVNQSARLNNPQSPDLDIPSNKTLTGNPSRPPVTNEPSFASFNHTAGSAMETGEEDGRKNRLRGFFRKVTRTLEKRTNIDATDEDEKLLLGGLAIRLK